MPELAFERVLSASSEVKNFPASNLLSKGEFKKWKCRPGELKAVVMLKLKEFRKIEKIDVGNEGSAFVEIFVGKSCIAEDEFQVILAASSFMTPMESRNNQNMSKVRFFDKEHLLKTALDQEWDVIKVVCTQPFNKNASYGLSFITLHSPPVADQPPKTLGAFTLKSEDQESSAFKVGSLFERSRQKQASVSVAATIRDASEKMLDADDEGKMQTAEFNNITSGKRSASDMASCSKVKESQAPVDQVGPPPKKLKHQGTGHVKTFKAEFSCLMKGLAVVLSGFQNPIRGQLRDKLAAMGGKYKADWEKDCTHLVCAFENTPKYNQVKGLGKIVKKEWIIDCFEKKQLLPWRDYRLGRALSPTDDKKAKRDVKSSRTNSEEKSNRLQNKVQTSDAVFDMSTDSECEANEDITKTRVSETERPTNSRAKLKSKPTDDPLEQLPELPDFLKGLNFFLYGDFPAEDRKCLSRYIAAYDGYLSDYMDSRVTTVITNKMWDESFDQALEDNPKLAFLHPDWLIECFEKQDVVPFKNWEITAD